jgi:cell volume regulation protein A
MIFLILVFLVKLNFENAIIVSIILSGISSIVIIPLIEKIDKISEKTKIKLILESTLTDVFVIILSLSIYQYLVLGTGDPTESIRSIFSNFVVGMFIGIFFGVIYLKINNEINKEEYPYVLTISFLFLSYFLSEFLGGNGGISSLFFGLVLGNGRHFSMTFFIKGEEIDYLSKHIFGLMTFLIVSFFFVYMGLFFNLTDPKILLSGIVISLFILLSRKISIYLFGDFLDLKRFEKDIVSCMIARGLSAGIMAFIFYNMNFLTDFEVNIIFSVILFTIILTTIAVRFVLNAKYKKV